MPELPKKKVGIVACSGEEMAEGTVSRLAALKVLEKFRPEDTVTICLPLFLAGGEGDRAFAKFYPTITIDGCDKRCAYRATEKYSNKPAGSIVISDLVAQQNLAKPAGRRKLDAAGELVVNAVAEQAAAQVDVLLGKHWSRREGSFTQTQSSNDSQRSDSQRADIQQEVTATCSCGSGIPIQTFTIDGTKVPLLALPLIYQNFYERKQAPSEEVLKEIMEAAKIYNAIESDMESAIRGEISQDYQAYWQTQEAQHEQN